MRYIENRRLVRWFGTDVTPVRVTILACVGLINYGIFFLKAWVNISSRGWDWLGVITLILCALFFFGVAILWTAVLEAGGQLMASLTTRLFIPERLRYTDAERIVDEWAVNFCIVGLEVGLIWFLAHAYQHGLGNV
jgi:hypothetical protein